MEDAIVKMVDLENEIAVHLERLIGLRRDIAEAISHVDSVTHRTLLELRYLCFKDWDEIAEELCYQRKYVFRLHRQALQKVDTKRYRRTLESPSEVW